MNREILFRAKRRDNSEWVEGSLISFDVDCGYVYITTPYPHASTLPVRTLIRDRLYLVDPETVCQYTGLTDKNGNKIWENDIVKINDDVKDAFVISDGQVIYQGASFIIGGSSANGTLNSLFAITDIYYVLRGEVIGNIFDNPELLNQ